MKTRLLSLAVFLLFLLSACAPGTRQDTGEALPSDPSGSDAAFTLGNGADDENGTFHIVSGLRSNASWGCSSESGFYSFLVRNDGSVNIRYLDYASCSEIVLCSSPDCLHNSESCTGWIAPGNGGAVPFVDAGHLYLAFLGNTFGIEGGLPPKIVRKDLDGQNEVTLVTFSSSETLLRPFISDGTYLYFLKKSYQMEQNSGLGTYDLMQMDLIKGTCTLLKQWSEPHTLSIVGTDGKSLLIRDIGRNRSGEKDNTTSQMEYIFSAFDPATGESNVVWSWQTTEEILERGEGRVFGDKYYYYNSKDHSIMQYDFGEGSLATLAENVPDLMTGTDGACFDCFVDGNLFIQNGTGFYAAVSAKTGEMTELTLSYAEGAKEKPVRIIDETADYFVITMGSKEVTLHGFNYDGLPVEFPSFEDTLALIPKQDYLENRANYILLKRYGE